jgi:hypothetical protein
MFKTVQIDTLIDTVHLEELTRSCACSKEQRGEARARQGGKQGFSAM